MLLFLLSVVCHAERWTGRFTVEFEENNGSQKQNFYISRYHRTLADTPSDIVDTNEYSRSTSSSDAKRHKPVGCVVKTTIIESISWQWLYATNLLVAYELTLTTNDTPLHPTPYSWLTVEMVVGWLLKNYWNPDSGRVNPIEQQAVSISRQGTHPFATITTMFGSGHNSPQSQPPESSGQQATQTTTQSIGYFTHLMHSDSGDGNEGSEQRSHTLSLNCLIHPCHGVCRFRPPDGREAAEKPLNSDEPKFGQLPVSSDDWLIVKGLFNLRGHSLPGETGISCTLTHSTSSTGTSATQPTTESFQLSQSASHLLQTAAIQTLEAPDKIIFTTPDNESSQKYALESAGTSPPGCFPFKGTNHCQPALSKNKIKNDTRQKTCNLTVVGEGGQQRLCGSICKDIRALWNHKNRYHTAQQTCNLTIIGEDGQQRTCGSICKNARAMLTHKNRYHSGQKTCNRTLVGEDGQQRPCGAVCKNTQTLILHKNREHTVQKTCNVTVVGEDGRQRPCGRVCMTARALSDHGNKEHTGQKICDLTVVGKDDQKQPCAIICKNRLSLLQHKNRVHSGPQTCGLTIIDEGGLQRSCGTLCKNYLALSNHKRRHHSGQKTCDITVVGEDGLHRPCGTVSKNAGAFSNHKSRFHRNQQSCAVRVVGADGQQRLCRTACHNAQILSEHKRMHLKRKPVDADQANDIPP
ncbi:hypothetical protein [Endozoicomonas sp. 8E]|uniref:hypothetical protein n=1 Tax=Endozoicomonas sp. 8E TaxID=3035692 RepID=UPI002938D268|nr:hypothetical protein [Endozoicomonas sp. 8E]WOG27034.1 hypothetical protein P6910_21155 [Endozoicomonas sp. 8E]